MPEEPQRTAAAQPVDTAGCRWLPGHAFVVRIVDGPAQADEAEAAARLALEQLSPFPPPQTAAGWHRFPDGRLAVFAAQTRSLPPTLTVRWETATRVLPDFAPALLAPPQQVPAVTVCRTPTSVALLTWTRAQSPDAIVTRRLEEAPERDDAAWVAWLARRQDRPPAALGSLRSLRLAGALDENPLSVHFALEGGPSVACAPEVADAWDVRPQDILLPLRQEKRRAALAWNITLGLAAALALLLLGEVGLALWRSSNTAREATVEERAPDAAAVDASLRLANRLESLAAARAKPFELLALINEPRPSSIYFVSTSFDGTGRSLEADSRAVNPADISVYETRLRALPGIELVNVRNTQSREGRTSFTLEVTFRPAAPTAAAPAPAPEPVDTEGGTGA